MEKQHPLNELMSTAMEKIRSMVAANTIIGDPMVSGDVTLIPVSRLSFGIASGGTDFTNQTPTPAGHSSGDRFGGGSGAGAKLEPVAFLIIRGESVRLLPVSGQPSTLDRVIEMVPEVMDKMSDWLDRQKGKKDPLESDLQD